MPRASHVTVTQGLEEGSDVFLTNRLITPDGTQLVQADINGTVTVKVYDVSGGGAGRAPTTAIFTKTDIPVSTVFDTYQTDGYWSGKDDTGYNFRYALLADESGATGPNMVGGHRYGVEFSANLDPSGGTDFGKAVWRHVLVLRPTWG
jgi:hypothetical protein